MAKKADYIGIYDEKTKEEKRKASQEKLAALLDGLKDEDKPELEMLLPEIAFCEVQLEELRVIISKDGAISTYQHGGGQSGSIKSPAVTTYVSLMGTYIKLMKQLNMLLKKARVNAETDAGSELLKWINRTSEEDAAKYPGRG